MTFLFNSLCDRYIALIIIVSLAQMKYIMYHVYHVHCTCIRASEPPETSKLTFECVYNSIHLNFKHISHTVSVFFSASNIVCLSFPFLNPALHLCALHVRFSHLHWKTKKENIKNFNDNRTAS